MDDAISFCELRKKEVINSVDGSKLGHIVDMIISVDNKTALGIVVPNKRGCFLSTGEDIFIPLCDITKIGEDVILVSLNGGKEKKDDKGAPCGGCRLFE